MFRRLIRSDKTPKAVATRKGLSPSVIAEGMHVLGHIISEGVLDIDGKIEGNVRGQTICVRPNGFIRGDVVADIVHVYGVVDGLIKAQHVSLYTDARVSGVIMHESITIEDGAVVDAKCKRIERVVVEEGEEDAAHPLRVPVIDVSFNSDNDNAEPPSEAEIKILEHLRLIS